MIGQQTSIRPMALTYRLCVLEVGGRTVRSCIVSMATMRDCDTECIRVYDTDLLVQLLDETNCARDLDWQSH